MHLYLLILAARAEDEPTPRLAERHGEQVAAIYAAARDSTLAYTRLGELCDTIGPRLSGSRELEQAVQWAAGLMEQDGLAVTLDPVQVPHWVRGDESAEVLEPVARPLEMLGLGMSVGGDVTGEVVVVTSFDELAALPDDRVQGRLVLFDVPFTSYGETVQYRGGGPCAAAAKGAVGALIRSVSPVSLTTPHTGATHTEECKGREIPAAALTLEDSSWIHREYERGVKVKVHLHMEAKDLGMAPSHNVIGELRGTERPDEIVTVGCHLDSWDVGQGAQDDGVGCLIAWESVRLLKELDLAPRRTVRVVLYTNEENGLMGGRAYAEQRGGEDHVALLESDIGNGRANGFGVDLRMDDSRRLRAQGLALELAELLEPLGGGHFDLGHSGADIGPTVALGVPGFGLSHDTETYWPIHHTRADTFDKVVLDDMQHNVGLLAAMVWTLAQMDERLVEPAEEGRHRKRNR